MLSVRKLNSFDLKNQMFNQNLNMRRSSHLVNQSVAPSVIMSDKDSTSIMRGGGQDNFDSSQDEIRRIVDDSKFDEFQQQNWKTKRDNSNNSRQIELIEPHKSDFDLSEGQMPFASAMAQQYESNNSNKDIICDSLKKQF